MQTLAIAPWSEALAAEVTTWPDHLLHLLARAGIGLVEAELPAEDEEVCWWYVSRASGERRELTRLPVRLFRPVLARLALFAELSPYCGHAVFGVEPFPNWSAAGVHRFSLFVCNEPTMGFWARLYLYCIDGVWPMRTAVEPHIV
ncbi:MAG: hypothetical protein L0241_25280 [Planctomycetia bacterium]|nr:hypothetical protein [Planctomycetia bacterium]